MWKDQQLSQTSVKPPFSSAPLVSMHLLSAAHLFWQWSHNLICALCLNKVAWVQINSNWRCQCRIMANILGALVNIQYGRQPHHPLRFLEWGQHRAIWLFPKSSLVNTLPHTKHTPLKHVKPQFNPEMPPQFKNHVKSYPEVDLNM